VLIIKVEVNHKEKDGTFVANGRVDKLAMALNKTEHSRRVVGVGAYVTPKQFFDVPKQSKSDMYYKISNGVFNNKSFGRKEINKLRH